MRVKALSIAGFLALSIAGISAQSTTTIVGYIMDKSCTNKKEMLGDVACAKRCVGRGSPAVLATEDGKVYKLKGEQSAVPDLVGEKVTVTGTVDDDTITITSITKQ
jgi:hypothetical protein